MLVEAREIFERLGATPWLEQLEQLSPLGRGTEVVTAGSATRSEPE
jgi:hypothetical protein